LLTFRLSSRVGGKDEHAVLWDQGCGRIADELGAVQVGDKRRMQPVHGDELTQGRNLGGKRSEQLPERIGLHLQFGDAGTLAWNAKKLNMHNASGLIDMIT